jgi:hypothetical protein
LNDADRFISRQHGPEQTESLAVEFFCCDERRVWVVTSAAHQDNDAM